LDGKGESIVERAGCRIESSAIFESHIHSEAAAHRSDCGSGPPEAVTTQLAKTPLYRPCQLMLRKLKRLNPFEAARDKRAVWTEPNNRRVTEYRSLERMVFD